MGRKIIISLIVIFALCGCNNTTPTARNLKQIDTMKSYVAESSNMQIESEIKDTIFLSFFNAFIKKELPITISDKTDNNTNSPESFNEYQLKKFKEYLSPIIEIKNDKKFFKNNILYPDEKIVVDKKFIIIVLDYVNWEGKNSAITYLLTYGFDGKLIDKIEFYGARPDDYWINSGTINKDLSISLLKRNTTFTDNTLKQYKEKIEKIGYQIQDDGKIKELSREIISEAPILAQVLCRGF